VQQTILYLDPCEQHFLFLCNLAFNLPIIKDLACRLQPSGGF
jgi:hypothetical protein